MLPISWIGHQNNSYISETHILSSYFSLRYCVATAYKLHLSRGPSIVVMHMRFENQKIEVMSAWFESLL
jgi:hypothetical protein